MVDTKYVISIPLDEDESEELGFPDLENMFRFMEILLDKGLDIDQIIIPEGSLIQIFCWGDANILSGYVVAQRRGVKDGRPETPRAFQQKNFGKKLDFFEKF